METLYNMVEPNEEIVVYSGKCQFDTGKIGGIYDAAGTFFYSWFPTLQIKFQCEVYGLPFLPIEKSNVEILIDEISIGSATINRFAYHSQIEGVEDALQICEVQGVLGEDVVLGDRSISVESIDFMIPNLRVLGIDSHEEKAFNRPFELIYDGIVITIQQCVNHYQLEEKLKKGGGFIFLYQGSIKKINSQSFSFSHSRQILDRLGYFLSFLGGQRISAMLIKGIAGQYVPWIDCMSSNLNVHSYRPVFSWPTNKMDLNSLWITFSKKWEIDVDNRFIRTAIYWYLEANVGDVGKCESSIILSQTALELIYNSVLIESKKMLIGRDAGNLMASNKIRLLLLDLNVPSYVPLYINDLKSLINDTSPGAPEVLVNIRNSLVHSNFDKLVKLNNITQRQKIEALTLFQWYVELALLKYLGFTGKYRNRTNTHVFGWSDGETVPWE